MLLIAGVIASPASVRTQSDVRMGVRQTGFERIPLEMKEIRGPGQYARRLEQVIRQDLDYSDLFRITGKAGQKAAGPPQVRIEGRVEAEGGAVVFRAFLKDAATGETIFGKRYRFNPDLYRRIAHHFVDEVVYNLTGETGIAQTRILYIRNEDDAKELYLIDYDGFGTQRLTADRSLATNPAWSHDGSKFVFTSYRGGNADLYVWDIAARSFRSWVSFPGTNIAPAWSRNGKEIAACLSLDGNAEIYVLDLTGKILRRLTHNWAIETSPSWSGNGREIAFVSDRTGAPHIYAMDAQGGNLRKLTFEGNFNGSPAWSPRGDRIAYVSRIEGSFQLFVMNADGSAHTQLTFGYGNHENPSWAPDGRHLVFSRDQGIKKDLYVLTVDTKRTRMLAEGESPAWSPPLDRSKPETTSVTHSP